MRYVDIHTHLTHERFTADWRQVIERAIAVGLTDIVVNGLEPKSNRQILAMASEFSCIKPALGIYPIDAVNDCLPADLPFKVERFDVNSELTFIEQQAQAGKLTAIGECGLDGHWVDDTTFAGQEYVFERFIEIGVKYKLPLIIHTRKREQRAIEILSHHRVEKVNFHCYGGRSKWAKEASERYGWYFSIPANARKNESFTKMLKILPEERILTETDAPYLAPIRGERNEPRHVKDTVHYWAELKGWPPEKAAEVIFKNYQTLIA